MGEVPLNLVWSNIRVCIFVKIAQIGFIHLYPTLRSVVTILKLFPASEVGMLLMQVHCEARHSLS